MTEPWERQQGETEKAFEAFQLYLKMGSGRTLKEVTKVLHKSLVLIGGWSSKWGWVERCRAYDNQEIDVGHKAHLQAIRDMNRRHAALWLKLQDKAKERLGIMDASELKPKDLVDFLVESVKGERVARGEAGDVSERRHDEDEKERRDKHATVMEEADTRELLLALSERIKPPPVHELNGKPD